MRAASKFRPLTDALRSLGEMQEIFRQSLIENFEHAASPCNECTTPGACCLDEHFVNVRISHLEAVAMLAAINKENAFTRQGINERIENAIELYDLSEVNEYDKTYACPLYEKGRGCIVHEKGKPAACVMHACYESERDMPPALLLDEQELKIDKLNESVYGRNEGWLSIPIALKKYRQNAL